MSIPHCYAQLEDRFAHMHALHRAMGILHWDAATMMPSGGAPQRAEELAALDGMAHQLLTGPEIGDWLSEANQQRDQLDVWQQANLREMQRQYQMAASVPQELVERLSKAGSECEFVWREARQTNDFAMLAPYLTTVIELVTDKAGVLSEALGLSAYDALLELYDPGCRQTMIDPIFAQLADALPPMIDQAIEQQAGWQSEDVTIDVVEQEALARDVMAMLGFDRHHGRLDRSLHPFCGGGGGDVRITARYHDADWLSGVMAVCHETGHAIYEQQLPKEWRSQPVGAARGMALHESQSLLVEMQLCRSLPFMQCLLPMVQAQFGQAAQGWGADRLHCQAIRVQRGFIRVDADELTYPLHVILRYRLEQALLSGALPVTDLPGAWNEGMEALLGVRPKNDAEGCMQDIHWMDGSIGYFPTYTLGALIAAQLMQAMRRDLPDLDDMICRGDFAPAMQWLGTQVHHHASLYETDLLVEKATGMALSDDAFLAHVTQRYLER